MADITQELCDFISKTGVPSEFAPFLEHPTTLVGKTIKQRFQDESGDPESCVGTVIDYRGTDKTRAHCIE